MSLNPMALYEAVGQKAIFILLALVLFLMFSPYSVLLFMDERDHLLTRDLAKHPEAVNFIIFLVLCKFAAFGVVFVSLPLVGNWFFAEGKEGPLLEREEVERARGLGARERALLSQGVVRLGRVLEVRGRKVWVEHKDGRGELHRVKLKGERGVPSPKVGESLALLCDPLDGREVVAPSMMGVSFEGQEEVEDARPARLTRPALPREAPKEVLSLDLLATLQPMPRAKRWGRGGSASAQVGSLVVRPEGELGWRLGGQAPKVIRLDQPFQVGLGAWLLGDGRAEVLVSLRPRKAQDAGLVFQVRTEWDARCVSKEVPLQQDEHPSVAPEEFARLWEVVRFYAAAHGEDPGHLLALPEDFGGAASEGARVGAVVGAWAKAQGIGR